MGFLDNLVKKGIQNTVNDVSRRAQKAAGNALGDVVEDAVTDGLSKLFGTTVTKRSDSSAEVQSSSEQSDSESAFSGGSSSESFGGQKTHKIVNLVKTHKESFTPETNAVGSLVSDRGSAAYFADVITKNVPGASVRTDVALSEISSEKPEKQVKIDALVSIDGTPKLAILLPSKEKYRNHAYLYTMNACENAGIPAIRFMKEFNNEPGYVSARVKAVIR